MREVTVVGVREWPARAVNKNSTQLNIPALLAQLVERLACNPKVRGSIPSGVVPVEGEVLSYASSAVSLVGIPLAGTDP